MRWRCRPCSSPCTWPGGSGSLPDACGSGPPCELSSGSGVRPSLAPGHAGPGCPSLPRGPLVLWLVRRRSAAVAGLDGRPGTPAVAARLRARRAGAHLHGRPGLHQGLRRQPGPDRGPRRRGPRAGQHRLHLHRATRRRARAGGGRPQPAGGRILRPAPAACAARRPRAQPASAIARVHALRIGPTAPGLSLADGGRARRRGGARRRRHRPGAGRAGAVEPRARLPGGHDRLDRGPMDRGPLAPRSCAAPPRSVAAAALRWRAHPRQPHRGR